MTVHPREPLWVMGTITEIADGDLIDVRGRHYRVAARTYPAATSPTVRITLPDGSNVGLYKHGAVKIFDPDGSVRARLRKAREVAR